MLLRKEQLLAAKLASTDTTRPALTCIRIEPNGTTWASDGSVAVKVTVPEPPTELYPEILAGDTTEPTGDVLMPGKLALDLAKQLPKGRQVPDLLKRFAILRENVNETACETFHVGTTDLDTPHTSSFDGHPNPYPDIECIYADLDRDGPEEKPHVAGFDFRIVQRLAVYRTQAFPLFDSRHNTGVHKTGVELRGAKRAASLRWSAEGVDVHALLMPVHM